RLARLAKALACGPQGGGRPRLEALQADLDAAAVAVAVLVRVDSRDGFVDLLDQLALAVAVAQLERHVGFLACAVVRIGEHRRLVLHGVHRAVDFLRQLRLQRLEDLAEMLPLGGIHVLLALLRRVRGETFSGEFYGHLSAQKTNALCITNTPPSQASCVALAMR